MSAIGNVVLPVVTVLPFAPLTDQLLSDPFPLERLRILSAIRVVETGGLNRPVYPDGDRGRSIGPLQISHAYWCDALLFDPTIGGDYQDCRRLAYAERVVRAYMLRYVPEAWERADPEVIARTHNGGPRGAQRKSTLPYWEKVKAVLAELE